MDDLSLGVRALPPISARPSVDLPVEFVVAGAGPVKMDTESGAQNGALGAQNGALRLSPCMYQVSVFDTRIVNDKASTYVEALVRKMGIVSLGNYLS